MSRVYASNIAGSTIGPLLVNFGLLQYMTTQMAFAVLGITGICIAAGLVLLNSESLLARVVSVPALALSIGIGYGAYGNKNYLVTNLSFVPPDTEIRHIVETRQGIIVSYKTQNGGDIVYGGNVYDGRSNVDPHVDSNGLNRILVIDAAMPTPRRVLIIGLSVGSWAYLVTGFSGVETIDVVEINPGYFDLIKDYAEQSSMLRDPRIKIHVGDGRKFLLQNPELKYELVVMNNTFFWRAYASLLLSKELL